MVTTFVMWTFVYSTISILTIRIKCRMMCKTYIKDRQNSINIIITEAKAVVDFHLN
jgi:hypothetical protein